MADDVLTFPDGGATTPVARLCNFRTGDATLLPAHRDWLLQNVVRSRGSGPLIIRLWGYASKLGGARVNQELSLRRSNAVRRFLEEQMRSSLPDIEVGGYGEDRSSGPANDNSGVYRAVDVYVYRTSTPPPPPQTPPEVRPQTQLYFGLGVKYGGIAAIGGAQNIYAQMFSVADYNDSFTLEAQLLTLGLGLGGGANVVFVIASGGTSKSSYNGLRFEGWDFALSLGGRWGDALRGVKQIPAIARIARIIRNSGTATRILRGLTRLSPEEWEKVSELLKTIRDSQGVEGTAERPNVSAFDIPLAGVSVEVSIYHWWASVQAIN